MSPILCSPFEFQAAPASPLSSCWRSRSGLTAPTAAGGGADRSEEDSHDGKPIFHLGHSFSREGFSGKRSRVGWPKKIVLRGEFGGGESFLFGPAHRSRFFGGRRRRPRVAEASFDLRGSWPLRAVNLAETFCASASVGASLRLRSVSCNSFLQLAFARLRFVGDLIRIGLGSVEDRDGGETSGDRGSVHFPSRSADPESRGSPRRGAPERVEATAQAESLGLASGHSRVKSPFRREH